jgi:hypothetical protein
MARLELAQSALMAALAPVETLRYRLAELEAAAAQMPADAGRSGRMAALAARLAAADQ